MSMRCIVNSRISLMLLVYLILMNSFLGFISSAMVTLDSIEIFKTHDWFNSKPTVYFQCEGENKTTIPDVREAHILYTFKGEESWQPLTEFSKAKCKRCGFYEKDILSSDDIFDEWEFCPSDFSAHNGNLIHFKDKEFNATFLCPECVPIGSDMNHSSGSPNRGKRMHIAVVITISMLVSTVFILGLLAAYKYWQKRKREQEQARFLKLFEEGDDIEDELGIEPLAM